MIFRKNFELLFLRRTVLLFVVPMLLISSVIYGHNGMSDELIGILDDTLQGAENGNQNAAVDVIQEYLRNSNQTLHDVLQGHSLSPSETLYVAILLLMDGSTISCSETALPVLYLSGALYECENDECLFGTSFVWHWSSAMMRWILSRQELPRSTVSLVKEFLELTKSGYSRITPPPPEYGTLAGGSEAFIARRDIPDMSLLLPLLPIEEAFHVVLNHESDQAVAFVEELSAATGIEPEIEPTTHYNHLILSLRYSRELAAQLLAATPALRERYDPAGHHTNTGETRGVTGGAVPCETTP